MAYRLIGYEFLRESLATCAHPLKRPAAVFSVTRVISGDAYLQVPSQVAPQTDAPLEHLLFALKHEGLELQHLMLALKHVDAQAIGQAFTASPSSAYLRQLGYLWETAHGQELQGLPPARGGYVALFDPAKFITVSSALTVRNTRWRVDFNGLGTPQYSPTVRRTPAITALLQHNTLSAAADYVAKLAPSILDRCVRWAYLSETQGSYEIEREMPTDSKAKAFAALLAHAHQPEPVTEQYLVDLQQLAVTNPLDKAFEFRHSQNWLRNSHRGANGITYVPPPPADLVPLMDNIMAMANSARHSGVPPLVMGSLVSFAFVFAHPFMDGNGRLSRFLFHRVVCSSGELKNGLVLPISIAMKRHEDQYLAALQDFSRPARQAWDIQWIDGDTFDLRFTGEMAMYRYWDATAAVEFGLAMAHEALNTHLRQESDYLQQYDRIYAAVNDTVDMNGNDLAILVRGAIENNGVISNGKIKRFISKGHPPHMLLWAQQAIARTYEENATPARQERLEALPGLATQTGAAHTLWQLTSTALDDAQSYQQVQWDQIHQQVMQQGMTQNGQSADAVLHTLTQHSPAATTQASHAALRLLSNLIATTASQTRAKG